MITALPAEWLPDPMTAVYRRLRTGILAAPSFAGVVKPADMPDLSDKTFQQIAEDVSVGRLPEIVVAQSEYKLLAFGTNSMVSTIVQGYDFIITVDKLQVTPLNKVKWALLIALYGLGSDLGLPGLVSEAVIRDGVDDPFGQEQWKRGTNRYVSLTRVVVTMNIPRSLMRALAFPAQ